jgi:hypothetical protein
MEVLRRCRGIPLADGNFTGCAYDDGDLISHWAVRLPVCRGGSVATTVEETSSSLGEASRD